MKLLLDQGLPRSTALLLRNIGIATTHIADIGLATATDAAILETARNGGSLVVTLDADFHALLALSGAGAPSVIRIRIEGLRGYTLANLLVEILAVCRDDLAAGAMVSVTESGIRVRRLPLVR